MVRGAKGSIIGVLLAMALAGRVEAAPLPGGPFALEPVITGLEQPVAARFAKDGRVFVAELRGTIKTWDSLGDRTADLAVDLTRRVHIAGDRGLMSFELDPNYPARPYAWALYALDVWGKRAPAYGPPQKGEAPPFQPGDDRCPEATVKGCPVAASLDRLRLDPATGKVVERVSLISGTRWCQHIPAHSLGSVVYGPGPALYVSAGDSAHYQMLDHGQVGDNPCRDPLGKADIVRADEGGSLRAQDILTPRDPLGYDGTVIRIDPYTGQPLPDNPLAGGAPADDRIVAVGLRNPYRMALDARGQLWIGDVGWSRYEEIDVIDPRAGVQNFGWPCYEGPTPEPSWKAFRAGLCERLYRGGEDVPRHLRAVAPAYSYAHGTPVAPAPRRGECGAGGALTAMTVHPGGGGLPAEYTGALIFGDSNSTCVFAMSIDAPTGRLRPETATVIATGSQTVDLTHGPDGEIYGVHVGRYAGPNAGRVMRLGVLGPDPSCDTNDRFEPNPDPAQATQVITQTFGTDLTRLIACPDDEDWFRFPAAVNDRIYVYGGSGNPSAAGLTVDVFGPDSAGVGAGPTSGGGTAAQNVPVEFAVQAARTGTHYVRVRPSPFSALVGYNLTLRTCRNDAIGHGATLFYPRRVPARQLVRDRRVRAVSCPSEIDSYTVDAERGDRFFLTLAFPRQSNMDAELFATPPWEGGFQGVSKGRSELRPYRIERKERGYRAAFEAPATGRFYVDVLSHNGYTAWPYTITCQRVPRPPGSRQPASQAC